MTADAANRTAVAGRKIGDKLLRFFLVAIRADSLFRLRIHGLQQDEILAAGFAHILVKRHETTPFLNDSLYTCMLVLAFVTLSLA